VTLCTGFSIALLLLWLLAGPCLYAAARVFFTPAPAAVLAVVCLFSPMTLLFAPGKDPAQLLTVALPLWLWLVGWRHRRSGAALLAGGAFVLACLVSLVHVWIAAIVLIATGLSTHREDLRYVAYRGVLPAVLGAIVVIGALRLGCDLDLFATAWAAARAQVTITRGVDAMPIAWQLLGIPLFLLFASPALWWLGLSLLRQRLPDQDARFGLGLLCGSAVVMVATVAFTNVETPRLWIPFTPLLLFGAALQLPAFRRAAAHRAALLTVLVFVQFAVAAAQWSRMDAREAETRLLQDEQGKARFFE
jgi:hypothetical protein